jgi:tetratricopeptide (TPR) repeat protein
MTSELAAREVFVGRDGVLKRFEASFKKLIEDGCGHVFLVAGEAGIGKTTVVNRFLNSLSPSMELRQSSSGLPFYVVQAKCNDITTAGNPYAPFAELLDGLSDKGSKGFREVLQDWAQDLGPRLLEGIVPYLGPLLARILERQLPIRDKDSRVNVVIASGHMYQFLQLLNQVSEVSPLILFIDDLQWADESSINLIFALARRVAEMRILLIGTYRPHDIAERPGYPAHPLSRVLLEMQRYDLSEEVQLEQFTLEEVEIFLDRRYPNNRFPSSLAKTLYEKTNGNPFFLDQVVRLLTDERNISLDANSRWRARSLDTVPIPEGALAIVQARIANLDDASGDLLRYASVMGEQFRSPILAELLGHSHLSVLRSLRTLENNHNLVRQRTEAAQGRLRPNWEFRHAFVRQALYDSLAADEQAEIHSLVVDALESRFPNVRDDLAGELAHHCEAAKRYEEGVPYRLSAAIRANRTKSLLEQVTHCTKGISAIEQLKSPQAMLREEVVFRSGLADAYRRFMDLEKVDRVAHELLRLAEIYHDPLPEIEGYLRLLQTAVLRRNRHGIFRYSTQAWGLAHKFRTVYYLIPVIGFFHHDDSVIGVYSVVPEQLKQLLDEAVGICRGEKALAALSRALICRGNVAFLGNEGDQGLSLFSEAIQIAGSIEGSDEQISRDYPFYAPYFDPRTLVDDCVEHIGRIHRRLGDWEQAIKEFTRIYKRKEEEKNLPGMAGLLNVIAGTQLQAGVMEDAEQSFQQSWTIAQQTDSSELKAMVLSTGISIAQELENDTGVEKRLQLLEEVSGSLEVEWVWHKINMTKGILSMRAGAIEQATSILAVGLKAAEDDDNLGLITEYTMHLAELNLNCGSLDQALYYADTAVQIAREHSLWGLGEACLISARVRTQAGKSKEAVTLAEQAIEYFQSKNVPHKAALAQDFRRKIDSVVRCPKG